MHPPLTMHRYIATAILVAVAPFPPAIVGFSHPLASSSFFRHRIPFISSAARRDDVGAHAIDRHRQIESSPSSIPSRWGRKSSPYLAILTESDACSSMTRVEETVRAIDMATADGGVDLVVLRVVEYDGSADDGEYAILKWNLLGRLAEMKYSGGRVRDFVLVVNDDVEIVLEAWAHNVTVDGVHVKERNAHLIPSIRDKLERAASSRSSFGRGENEAIENIVIGTSCHSIESGARSYALHPRGPDYLFVGTCYPTESHPEKRTMDQLEGPDLPGIVKKELHDTYNYANRGIIADNSTTYSRSTPTMPPVVFAIGGIDERNCHEPVIKYGADGVAVIRTVMHAPDPGEVVRLMKRTMKD